MKKVNVKKGSEFIVFDGPSPLGIEHSLFDEHTVHESQKRVLFKIRFINQPTAEDRILKFKSTKEFLGEMKVEIIAALRVEPLGPGNWILWGRFVAEGMKVIIHYSTATRLGCGKVVDAFPDFSSF
jgi:hypothetical protein